MRLHSNKAFRDRWEPEVSIRFPATVPTALIKEANNLLFIRDCLFIESLEGASVDGLEANVERYLKTSDSNTGVEYSLNKRHIFDYLDQDQWTDEYSLGVFGQFKDLIMKNATKIGVTTPIGFLWSSPIVDNLNSKSDPVMTLFRVLPEDPAVDVADIEGFELDRCLVIIFDPFETD
jgi:hypothetical protein